MGIDDRTGDNELSTAAVQNDDNQDLETLNVFGRAEDREVFSLPPADGGKDAWLFLASCVIFEAVSWGESVFGLAKLHAKPSLPYFPNKCFPDITLKDFLSVSVSSSHTTSSTLPTMGLASPPLVLQQQV